MTSRESSSLHSLRKNIFASYEDMHREEEEIAAQAAALAAAEESQGGKERRRSLSMSSASISESTINEEWVSALHRTPSITPSLSLSITPSTANGTASIVSDTGASASIPGAVVSLAGAGVVVLSDATMNPMNPI
jgi:hypothetical protein